MASSTKQDMATGYSLHILTHTSIETWDSYHYHGYSSCDATVTCPRRTTSHRSQQVY